MKIDRLPDYIDALLLAALVAFMMVFFDIRYLFHDTVVTGGDTASWHGVAHHLAKVLLPSGRLTGWDMGNFCGYPNFTFYFLPPFLLAVIPSILFSIPLTITLKWAIMSGLFLFPVAVYFGLRKMGHRFPMPVIGASGSLLLLFNESYTMFGGNTLSTFAGEFCYMFAFALFAFFIGSFYKGFQTETRAVTNGVLLGLIGMSHLFIFIPALVLLVYAYFNKASVRYLLKVGGSAFACMAFWILPLVVYRHPYTTPVYMIWQEFVNLRYSMAGVMVMVLFIAPGFSLFLIGQKAKVNTHWHWAFAAFATVGVFAGVYLLGEYLFLGKDLWYKGLNVPNYATGLLTHVIPNHIEFWVLPAALLLGMATGVLVLRAGKIGSIVFARYCRVVGSLCFLMLLLLFLLWLHTTIVREVPSAGLRTRLSNGWTLLLLYGPVIIVSSWFLLLSRRFGIVLHQIANQVNPDRFFMWLSIVFGCIVAYFSAHFLMVPDIRFLPPLLFALLFVFFAETLGPFVIHKSMAVKVATAVTASYLALLTVIFGADRSDAWYRFNNLGYEATPGFSEYFRVNHYLKTAYEKSGLDPINAPRVGYEKCDLYESYGGDRAFESLPLFSGRQTLEGIHFAGSIASPCIAFLQTEFSRDIKTPKPQVLSKINPEALPAHFNLYNISQLLVMTDKTRKALSSSPLFEKEATFGDITLFRYTECNGRYVDVPKVRPVLYTGEKWVDDFYEWFKDSNRVDVLLVPARFVKDKEDRALFSGETDLVTHVDQFRSKALDRKGLEIDAHLGHLQIRFTTNKVGLPHLIKVSYFPNWTVKGAHGIYPASPHLMMVIPREKEVVLSYERTPWELLGLWITCGWVVFLIFKGAIRITNPVPKWNPRFQKTIGIHLERTGEITEKIFIRARPFLFGLLMVGALGLIVAGAICRNRPVRTYVTGYREYKHGTILSRKGNEQQAAKRFSRAIHILAPLLKDRTRYDHRDVVNSLLCTAMCYENLGEYAKAESWYQTVLTEYPHSRYVGEGYVKIARIYKLQTKPLLHNGLKHLREGNLAGGKQLLKEGLALMEKSLQYYDQAIRKDPYSIWAEYAVKDLENEQSSFNKTKKDIYSLLNDSELTNLLESLTARIRDIKKMAN